MLKKIGLIILSFVFAKFLLDYFYSPEFQRYGDENKAQWTCYVNNVIGELYVLMSRYKDAEDSFRPILERCSNSSLAEIAEFKVAECLDKENRRSEAIAAYMAYIGKYPASSYSAIAQKNIEILQGLR